MYNEDVAQYDESQLIADNLARLRRKAEASQPADTPLVVYPDGYLPPEVERAKAHRRYKASVATYRTYSRRRLRNQGRR
jgi:hypothetical protein